MQRWEYMTWLVGNGGKGPVRERDGEAVPDWKKGPPLARSLNDAGREGWELFETYTSTMMTEPFFIFRRSVMWDA